jgi:biotin-dependent carboxylase-like uncharacterized protein
MIEVQRAGALTSVQDAGRFGQRHLGIGASGALDAYSARVANLLVGNRADAALLECTLAGPTLRFTRAVRIALTGAPVEAEAQGVALPGWRPVELPAGSVLQLGACRSGVRSYVAIDGGIALPPLLGSAATDLRAGFGGHAGRALRAGDRLALQPAAYRFERVGFAPWWIDPAPDLSFADEQTVHVLPGHDATLPAAALLHRRWRVSAQSDRQGLRLEGPPLQLADARDRVSEPVAPGTVQLPPDGQPIVLLTEAQTVGGYPRVGHVVSADLPRLAQCRPGDGLRFVPIDPAGARARWRAQAARLARIALAIEARSGPLRTPG